MKKLKRYIKRIIKLIGLDEMRILPGHLAFNILLMIVPIFSVIGVLGSQIEVSKLEILVTNNVPTPVLNIIESALNINSDNFNLILFVIFSLWIISKGCLAIINSGNVLYKVKNTNQLNNILKSFSMVLILFLLISFIIIVPILGDFIIKFLLSIFKNEETVIKYIYDFLKYPISIVLMFGLIKSLYILSSPVKIKYKYMNNGAFFTTLSWLFLTRIYSYHLNNYSNYNLYYGSLAGILIILVWVYLLAYLFMIGMALNADNYFISTKEEKEKTL